MCCIVARTIWFPVSRKYKDAVLLKLGKAEAEAEREAERQHWKDVGQL